MAPPQTTRDVVWHGGTALLRLCAERPVADLHLRLRLVADLDAGDGVRCVLVADQRLLRARRAAVDHLIRGIYAVAPRGCVVAVASAPADREQHDPEADQC